MDRPAVKHDASKSISVARRVVNAIKKLQGKEGISLPDLKKYLRDERKMDLGVHNSEINFALKHGVDRGILLRESGNYKVREAKRRSRSRSGKRRSRRRSGGRKRSRSRRRSGSRRRRSRRRKRSSCGNCGNCASCGC